MGTIQDCKEDRKLRCTWEEDVMRVCLAPCRTATGLVLATVAVACVSGCDPTLESAGLFVVEGTTRDSAWVIPDRVNLGANPGRLRGTAGDMQSVRYSLGRQRRAFLFTGDLETGISGGDYLHLPILDVGELERVVPVNPFDATKWLSFRVYDSGLCSLLLGWDATAGLGFLVGAPPIADLFVGAIDGAVTGSPSILGGRRTEPGTVTPVLRAVQGTSGRGLTVDTDTVRISASYFADRLQQASGADIGCNDVAFTISVEVGFRRTNGGPSNAPSCEQPGDPGGILVLNDGFTFDFEGVVYDVRVHINYNPLACTLTDLLESAIASGIRSALPRAVAGAVLNASLLDPRQLGFSDADIRACTCDGDCNTFAPNGSAYGFAAGRRPRCHFDDEPVAGGGECWIQLEIDRLNVRPEGIEVVLMEDDTDRQYPLLAGVSAFVCEPNFDNGAVDGPDPLLRTMSFPLTVP